MERHEILIGAGPVSRQGGGTGEGTSEMTQQTVAARKGGPKEIGSHLVRLDSAPSPVLLPTSPAVKISPRGLTRLNGVTIGGAIPGIVTANDAVRRCPHWGRFKESGKSSHTTRDKESLFSDAKRPNDSGFPSSS